MFELDQYFDAGSVSCGISVRALPEVASLLVCIILVPAKMILMRRKELKINKFLLWVVLASIPGLSPMQRCTT